MSNREKNGIEAFVDKSKGAAYPLFVEDGNHWVATIGLTKLEVFTKAAIQGLLSNPGLYDRTDSSDSRKYLIDTAVEIAEMSLKKLKELDTEKQ